jgi:ankyrin repeat protein
MNRIIHIKEPIDINIIKCIIESTNINAKYNDNHETLLHMAARTNQIHITHYLIESNANINSLDRFGNTPLHIASGWGHLDIVKYLLSHGIDPTHRNKYLDTAADVAVWHPDIKQYIRGFETGMMKMDR